MSCDTSPPITCSTAAITCSSPSGRKRTRETEEDEAFLDTFIHKKYLSQNEETFQKKTETISEFVKQKDERVVVCELSPLVKCSQWSGKRTREPEDEDYLDNYQSSKRYFSQMMASGLNGLKVEDSHVENHMESPASSGRISNTRDDDLSPDYFTMSKNTDEPHIFTTSDSMSSPKSPPRTYTCQSEPNSDIIWAPRSPSDRCHNKDLRRTALLRSIQLRNHQWPMASVLPFVRDQEGGDHVIRTSEELTQPNNIVARSCLNIELLDGFLPRKCHL